MVCSTALESEDGSLMGLFLYRFMFILFFGYVCYFYIKGLGKYGDVVEGLNDVLFLGGRGHSVLNQHLW